MQHDKVKCKKCGGFVVGRDAIDKINDEGWCSHCQQPRAKHFFGRKPPKSTEQKTKEKLHRATRLAERALKNQQMRRAHGKF